MGDRAEWQVAARRDNPSMHLALQDVLVCPSCHARLTWQVDRAERDEMIEAPMSPTTAGATRPRAWMPRSMGNRHCRPDCWTLRWPS
jgi:uncharacterized protein YbaR (Trm112 family)